MELMARIVTPLAEVVKPGRLPAPKGGVTTHKPTARLGLVPLWRILVPFYGDVI
jgi:hypothetical protein